MNLALKQFFLTFFVAILAVSSSAYAAPAGNSFKTIQNSGGVTIVYGPLSDQLSYQAALSETLTYAVIN